MGSARASVMKFLVLLSVVSLASAAPLPEGEEAAVAVEAEAPVAVEEDAPAALPYVHDATGDVAEPYVHEDIPAVEEEIAAEPYVHDITGDVAEAYVHEEIAAEVYEHDATGDVAEGYTHEDIAAEVYTEHPLTYSYAAYPYAVYHTSTGCVNNVGSVVPCAQIHRDTGMEDKRQRIREETEDGGQKTEDGRR